MTALASYYLFINIITFSVYAADKKKAILKHTRVSEKTLILLAAAGGALGALLAMRIFRHKTRHRKFTVTVPILLLVHALFVASLCIFA